MRISQMRKNPDLRPDHCLQLTHLSRHRDSGFNDGQTGRNIHTQQRQRDSDL